jgi:hypothetical protein
LQYVMIRQEMNVAGFEEVAGEVSGFRQTIADQGRNFRRVDGCRTRSRRQRRIGLGRRAWYQAQPGSRVAGLAPGGGGGWRSAGAPKAPCPAEERPASAGGGWKEEILAEEIIARQPPAAAGGSGGGLRRGLLGAAVVFVAVDFARQPVILAIYFCFFRPGQPSTIGRAITADFTVHGRFFAFEMRSFASGQLTALYTLPDPLLLVQGALADFAARRLGCGLADGGQGEGRQSSTEKYCRDFVGHGNRLRDSILCQPF